MANPVEALLILIGACFAAGAVGASFIFGVALVCRWMGWAPVNTTVHIHYHEAFDDVGKSREQT
jgi:hypothetical protein